MNPDVATFAIEAARHAADAAGLGGIFAAVEHIVSDAIALAIREVAITAPGVVIEDRRSEAVERGKAEAARLTLAAIHGKGHEGRDLVELASATALLVSTIRGGRVTERMEGK